MAYDNGPRYPETDARAQKQPQRQFLATLFVTILVRRGRVNFRNLRRSCDDAERTIARQFREPFDWPAFHQRVLMTALDPRAALVSAHAPPSSRRVASRRSVRALLQRLYESCRAWPGDVHARGERSHPPVRFYTRGRADTTGRGRHAGRAGGAPDRLLQAAAACASASLAAEHHLAWRGRLLCEEDIY